MTYSRLATTDDLIDLQSSLRQNNQLDPASLNWNTIKQAGSHQIIGTTMTGGTNGPGSDFDPKGHLQVGVSKDTIMQLYIDRLGRMAFRMTFGFNPGGFSVSDTWCPWQSVVSSPTDFASLASAIDGDVLQYVGGKLSARPQTLTTFTGSGTGSIWYPLCVLPDSAAGTSRDSLFMLVDLGGFDSATRQHLTINVTNRGGFLASCTYTGALVTDCAIQGYYDTTTGTTTIYLKLLNNFRVGTITALNSSQATFVRRLVGSSTAPTGTKNFDSAVSAYRSHDNSWFPVQFTSAPMDGQVLVYDATSGQWKPGSITGGVATSVQTYSSGTAVTLANAPGRIRYQVNPAAIIPTVAFTLPPNPVANQIVDFEFGGQLTTGTVVTNLSILPNTAQSILQQYVPTTADAGDRISFEWNQTSNLWLNY